LRPPVLRSKNRIGFLHDGQIGGGVFLAMMLTLDQARVSALTVTDYCRGRGGDELSVKVARQKCLCGNRLRSQYLLPHPFGRPLNLFGTDPDKVQRIAALVGHL
jgi:hypothetical protein